MSAGCEMSKKHASERSEFVLFANASSQPARMIRSSWRGSRLNAHTISMEHSVSQTPVSDIDLQKDRSVVLSGPGIQHVGPHNEIFDALADQEVVDSPSAVIDFARSDPLCPP